MTANIVKTPDVLHGQPRIEGTRLGVFMLGEMIRRGNWTAEEVIDEWDELTREHIDLVLDYYDSHPEEMAAHRRERDVLIQEIDERERDVEQEASRKQRDGSTSDKRSPPMAHESDRKWALEPLTDEEHEQAQERIAEAFDEARAWLAEDDDSAIHDPDED